MATRPRSSRAGGARDRATSRRVRIGPHGRGQGGATTQLLHRHVHRSVDVVEEHVVTEAEALGYQMWRRTSVTSLLSVDSAHCERTSARPSYDEGRGRTATFGPVRSQGGGAGSTVAEAYLTSSTSLGRQLLSKNGCSGL